MTLRTPLYDNSGTPTEIGSADYLDSDIGLAVLNNETGATLVKCTPVYASDAGEMSKAQANAKSTSKVIGLVMDPTVADTDPGPVQTCGVLTATAAEWDAVTGGSGGLTVEDIYFLDASTAGKLTPTAPNTTGNLVARVGKAVSATEMQINIEPPILL